MNLLEKTQPPSGVAIIATEGFLSLVLSSFLPQAIKEQFPKTKVYLFTASDALRYAHCFHFDEVMSLGSNRAQNTAKLLFQSKIKNISHFIDLDEHQTRYFNFTNHILSLKNLDTTQTSDPEKYLLILQSLNITPKKLNFKIKVRGDVYNHVRHELLDHDFNLKNIYIASPQGEGFFHKSWKSFDSVLRPWLQNGNKAVLIVGENTWEESQKMHDEFPNQLYLWKKHRTFEETVALISQAKHFVGADSVWTHVATQLGVPTTALMGPSRIPSLEFQALRKNVKIFGAAIPCSPCQKNSTSFDYSCGDNVCMKSHSPEEIRARVYLP